MKSSVAVIQFPGSNCEYETLSALQYYGISSEIIRWNVSEDRLLSFSGYVLPGGFSYQDRVRAGCISSRLPLISSLKKADAVGKPILGICNGCQILTEAGFVRNDLGGYQTTIALTPNLYREKRVGFICDWVYVKPVFPTQNLFTKFLDENDVLPIPINHGEGRFAFDSLSDDFSGFVYCTIDGEVLADYPVNPNGSKMNIAGLSNNKGNVLALMPHPERASKSKQFPSWISSNHFDLSLGSPWEKLFVSLKEVVERVLV